MNATQLEQLGMPSWTVPLALQAIGNICSRTEFPRSRLMELMQTVVASPADFLQHPQLSSLAAELLADQEELQTPLAPPADITYRSWCGDADAATHDQMRAACRIPAARQGALMPDAHVGYGLPIGGVLATEGVVIPWAVGVDIACRMKISILDLPPQTLDTHFQQYRSALMDGTFFGVGCEHSHPQNHSVLDEDWSITAVTADRKDRARQQLGTSGSGNHFVEFGTLTVTESQPDLALTPGTYVALLSHSGSRGAGAAVCQKYSAIARQRLPRRYADYEKLAWLALETEAGQEYWAAMNLMGRYAAANHDVIHRFVCSLLGAEILTGVENHHNFAWQERHGDRDLIVHRKGATPANVGELGVIPGSMADSAWVVRGLGNPDSLKSASHGAGRVMSRTKGKEMWDFKVVRQELLERGIHVLSAGADEVPGVYRRIEEVMAAQQDLVQPIARFDPRIVRMCGDGSRAED